MSSEFWTAVAVACIMSLPGIVSLFRGLPKASAETDKTNAEAAQVYKSMAGEQAAQIQTMQQQIDEQATEMRVLVQVVTAWQAGIQMLTTQIIAAGMQPVWKPGPLPFDVKEKGDNNGRK